MITITMANCAKNEQERSEFLKSLSYSNSGDNKYEIIGNPVDGFEKIVFIDKPSPDSVINITLPDNCIVLGNSWDRYIMHAVNDGLPKYGLGRDYVPDWKNYIQAKMGLMSRDQSGIFPDLKVEITAR